MADYNHSKERKEIEAHSASPPVDSGGIDDVLVPAVLLKQ